MKRGRYPVVMILPLVALALALVAGCAAPAAAPTPTVAATPTAAAATTPSAAQGKPLFDSNCASCHGANGQGGTAVGTATSANLRVAELGPKYPTDDLLRVAILDGKDEEGEALDQAMPRWRGKLSEAQVNDIIAYLKTLR